jgi:hypothetical protein
VEVAGHRVQAGRLEGVRVGLVVVEAVDFPEAEEVLAEAEAVVRGNFLYEQRNQLFSAAISTGFKFTKCGDRVLP